MGRLTNLPADQLPERAEAAALSYRVVAGKVLVTNSAGCHAQLEPSEFRKLMEGRLGPEEPLRAELRDKGFLRESFDSQLLSRTWRQKNAYLWSGPGLHIVVVTLRCNHKCTYCHASVVGESRTELDMTLETARAVVDFVFRSPRPAVGIEFQGGEPLLNWPAIEFITRYAQLRAKKEGRSLQLSIVSNFSMLDEAKFRFLVDNGIQICTSLDGPEELHNKNRIYRAGNSFGETVRWLRRFQELADERAKGPARHDRPGALLTTTRFSFEYPKQIIDTYIELGMPSIYVRPLSPIGFARRVWDVIGYTPEQYLDFYAGMVDRVLEANYAGIRLVEQGAKTLMMKVLRLRDPGHVDLRSPAGGGLGVLGYNYNGDVYTGDEGRMLAQEGSEVFRMGSVTEPYNEVLSRPVNRSCAVSSALEGQPLCSQCAYRPYCGVCPVYNMETQGSLWGQMPSNGRCRSLMGAYDILFERLRDPRARRVFESWVAPPPPPKEIA
jgi:His-Xaa-Ser system radical SAM maturase HxsB